MMLRKLVVVSLLVLTLLNAPLVQASSLMNSRVGAGRTAGIIISNGSNNTYAMAGLNTGWDARFTADSVLDVTALTVTWSTVSSAGVVAFRLETDDGTGKPSGTLYDTNATLTLQTPVAGTQTYTFAVAPTTGLTIGTLYHVVILTTTLGTTQTLISNIASPNPSSTPTAVLVAADGTTRSNFAIATANAVPALVLTRTGGVVTSFETMLHPFTSTLTSNNIYTTHGVAANIVTQGTLSVTGYAIDVLYITGTPAGDLRIRLMDGSSNVVAGSTVTVDKDVIVNGRGLQVPLGTAISPVAGTYRIVLDCASCADTSNCFNLKVLTAMTASAIPNATLDTTADVTATPPTWANTATVQAPMALLINGVTNAAAGGIIGG